MAKENTKAVKETADNEKYESLLARIEALEKEKDELLKKDLPEEKSPLSEEKQAAEDYLNEKVKIKLFKDGKDYKDDVVVGINGKIIQIKRGVEVEIERKYALLLDQAQIQSIKAAEMIEEKVRDFAAQNV